MGDKREEKMTTLRPVRFVHGATADGERVYDGFTDDIYPYIPHFEDALFARHD